ncbi:Leu/Ile/Val-binding protein-like protein 6 [Frankliniella fusca]|uniref:Leu/Ile/Val-binding protein-like protein 6 n=1 Tax=Frankliniella fusca TaxID=407009 RepID=A0AAE1I3Z3_9NEOP|nr:Leu/Ile/Val-binding protein-like protein 6 [Frankliniella fusca]
MMATIFKSASIPTTKHSYKERLNVEDDKDIENHVFCCRCNAHLGIKHKKISSMYCETCNKNVTVKISSNCFVSLSITSQLQTFLKDDYFVSNLLKHRFERSSQPGMYSDIYDGKVYKSFSAEGGILSSPFNFSFTFFTDGVAYGKSSNKTIWPIYLTVNEIPYHERSKYFILAGVYAGPKDPSELNFMKPFVDALNALSSTGIKWIYNGEEVTSIVIPICCVVDSVARCQLLNYHNYAGRYGCTFCYKMTEYVTKTGSRYPLIADETPEPRTRESYKEDLQGLCWQRNLINRAHRRVKGACNLTFLNHFSMFDSLVVDYMHCMLLGIVKKHTELILEERKMWLHESDDNIGVKSVTDLIDERISSLQSSTAVVRELRPITDHSLWRASEWRLWALFYFVPCLKGLLKDKHIAHFAVFSKALGLLLQKTVTDADIKSAHKLLPAGGNSPGGAETRLRGARRGPTRSGDATFEIINITNTAQLPFSLHLG